MTEPSKEVQRWGDAQQYRQEAMPGAAEGSQRVRPTVRILSATPDPLGVLAALTALYKGQVVRSLEEVTHVQRREALADMLKTTLNSALESVQFLITIEGIDRAFTHQHVRGRNAMYVQESMRFAVPEDWAAKIPLPPSLAGLPEDDVRVSRWLRTLNMVEDAYAGLVSAGMPAEEARGLLPHAILTRIHWVVTLRELLHVAGLRTCTQAQFIWRIVFGDIAKALREYGAAEDRAFMDGWQFGAMADLMRPVCYQTGKCAFKAKFDRECSIRERVDANERSGRQPAEWGQEADLGPAAWNALMVVPWAKVVTDNCHKHTVEIKGKWSHTHDIIPAIQNHEWAADPAAARVVGN